jgi:hypothetical protein
MRQREMRDEYLSGSVPPFRCKILLLLQPPFVNMFRIVFLASLAHASLYNGQIPLQDKAPSRDVVLPLTVSPKTQDIICKPRLT